MGRRDGDEGGARGDAWVGVGQAAGGARGGFHRRRRRRSVRRSSDEFVEEDDGEEDAHSREGVLEAVASLVLAVMRSKANQMRRVSGCGRGMPNQCEGQGAEEDVHEGIAEVASPIPVAVVAVCQPWVRPCGTAFAERKRQPPHFHAVLRAS